MSGTQWIYLRGIDCFEPSAIGILVLVDNGRQTEQGTLSLRVSDEGERMVEEVEGVGGWVMERREQGAQREGGKNRARKPKGWE